MTLARLLLAMALIGSGIVGLAYWSAISDPTVRFAEVEMLPPESSERQLRILLLSDIHVAGPDMPPGRLGEIVRQANAQKPDAVLIAGDFVSDKQFATKRFSFEEAIAPLQGLESRFGTFAVLGNHDHWRNAAAAHSALRQVGITVLDNSAARAGPLVIGGLDDAFTQHDDLTTTLRAMASLGGEPVLLSHSPDPFPRVPAGVKLMLAGHTHCGQIRLPVVGAISYMSEYGKKYACGVVVEDSKTLVVSAGLGTSILPLRLGAAPDMWVIAVKRRSHSTKSARTNRR
ncbi:metallophosphoesterase [Sphingomonas qomolangmaensis]|uniref:Metallophosphoesterase n=1 Tax=Sphingomonas qomolangmaensis TaxID=2918765 RepID=A0ABY5L779_9SPHN|nr:metallophosphoesterase [Sphingomonas qomolangmaensis]UUL81664.1 metallophosphoesterase [Sphingomonas qomolangmaensis]